MRSLKSIIASSLLLLWASVAQADIKLGVGLPLGQVETDGTETEGTAADTSDRTKSIKEQFIGADIFAEFVTDGGLAFGIKYIPMDIELGSGARTDVDGDDADENDNGTRSASADLTDFYTVYANMPVGGNGWYATLGYHQATVTTTETLNESSYGNADIDGYEIGLGKNLDDNLRMELSYHDFEDINLTASGGGTNSIAANADAVTFRLAYGF